jgi:hypothetical protein
MANSTTGKIWTLDTVGIVSKTPVWIKKLVLYPNSAADLAVLNYWNPEALISAGCNTTFGTAYTGTISSTTTLTISGGTLLPSTITDGSVFEIIEGTGTSANKNRPVLVTTAGNNTVVVTTDATVWTDESTKQYTWKTYQNYLFAKLLTPATEKQMIQMDFANPFRLPNLILETISSSATIQVFIA